MKGPEFLQRKFRANADFTFHLEHASACSFDRGTSDVKGDEFDWERNIFFCRTSKLLLVLAQICISHTKKSSLKLWTSKMVVYQHVA